MCHVSRFINKFRLLEFYILNGAVPNGVETVIQALSSQNRVNPQDLDKALTAFLREVIRQKDKPHIQSARTFRID